jgi:CrcB protein
MLKLTLGVAVGSALGGVLRLWLTHWAAAHTLPHHLPLGTIFVNIAGSFAIGYIAAVTTTRPAAFGGPMGHQVLMAGVLGGFTTFSAFSLQTLLLAQEGRWGLAVVNVAASVTLCLGAVAGGWAIGKAA